METASLFHPDTPTETASSFRRGEGGRKQLSLYERKIGHTPPGGERAGQSAHSLPQEGGVRPRTSHTPTKDGVVLVCSNCTDWRPDAIAHPELGERCGSLRICAKGFESHSGMWCLKWEARTPEQNGRLF